MDKQVSHGIWKYSHFLPPVAEVYRLSLDEGATPLVKIDDILFKLEFKNPTGSVKDRGIAYQVSKLLESGVDRTVVSSSGNAAISAASYCTLGKIGLTVFVSPKVNKNKLAELKKLRCNIVVTSTPIKSSIRHSKQNNSVNLRQSTSPFAVYGYTTLAYELIQQEKDIDAVFLPISSATTLVGLYEGYKKMGICPAIHGVQTEMVHPIASQFDRDFTRTESSLADAIVARFTSRLSEAVDIISKTRGWAWVVSDVEISKANLWLSLRGINCSFEGAAVLAAVWKARKKGYSYKHPVCLLTGKRY